MGKLIFLGTAGGLPSIERETMTVMLEEGLDRILIECCPSILRQLAKINVNPTDITSLFLSHVRSGHFLGFPALIFGNKAMERETKLLVLTPEGTRNFLQTIVENICPWDSKIRGLEIKEMNTKSVAEAQISENCRIKTAPVEHIVPVLGCRIEFLASNKVIAYSSDTKPCENLNALAERADILIHDSSFEHAAVKLANEKGHSTARQAGETANKAKVKTLVLVHPHYTRYNTPKFEEKAIREAEEVFDGEIIFAYDFLKLHF